MIALLLAGVCAAIPYFPFDPSGTACPAASMAAECSCSECISWDASDVTSGAPTVRWYNVQRTNPDGSTTLVGSNYRLDWLDDGIEDTSGASTVWCPARDVPMVREGSLYGYEVQACNFAGCTVWSGGVEYTGAPYAIDSFRPPVQGN
jgi:hypothetical protein